MEIAIFAMIIVGAIYVAALVAWIRDNNRWHK